MQVKALNKQVTGVKRFPFEGQTLKYYFRWLLDFSRKRLSKRNFNADKKSTSHFSQFPCITRRELVRGVFIAFSLVQIDIAAGHLKLRHTKG